MTARLALIACVFALPPFLGAQEDVNGKQFSWGKELDGLRLGIALAFPGPAASVNFQVTGVVHNKTDKTREIDTFRLKSNILSLKVYKTEDGKDPVPTLPPPLPPANPKEHVTQLAPGGSMSFKHGLDMFSPELKPGTYWVEVRYDKAVSPRIKVEIIAPTPAPDKEKARKLALDWVKVHGKEKWGEITQVEDRTDHWLVTFTLILGRGTPAQHPAGLFIYKASGRIQEALGE